MISRRAFLRGSGTLMLGASLLPSARANARVEGNRLLFGYPAGAIGSKLAERTLPLLAANGGPQYQLQCLDGRNTRNATEAAKAAPADGSVLLQIISTSFTLLPSIYDNIGFDPLSDFEPVALLGDFPYSLSIGPLVPSHVTTLDSYLEWVNENPEYRHVGVSIYGSLGHLGTRIISRAKGVALKAQPYRSTKSMLSDLSGGTLAAAFSAPGSNELKTTGSFRSIGVTSAERFRYWPDVPTFKEQGVAELDFRTWFGWFAPASVPAATLATLRQQAQQMKATSDFDAVQRELLLVPSSADAEQIRARLREESSRYRTLVGEYDIKTLD